MSDGGPTGEEFRQGFMGRGAEAWTVGLPPKLGGRLVVTRKACWRGTKDRLRSSQRLTGGPRHRQWVQVEWVWPCGAATTVEALLASQQLSPER